MDESANAYQAHNDPVDPGSDDGEEALDCDGDEDTLSSCDALDDVTVFDINLLADDLDPEVSAQFVRTLTCRTCAHPHIFMRVHTHA